MTDAEHVHDAVLEFDYDDEPRARIVTESVRPEVDDIAADRTHATVDRNGATITVTVTAADLVALRAGINTWTTLVGTAERCAGAEAPAGW